jgi:acyl-[acyl carrier protein]--UDP-N-acetylglucosamine O-acyltransferase
MQVQFYLVNNFKEKILYVLRNGNKVELYSLNIRCWDRKIIIVYDLYIISRHFHFLFNNNCYLKSCYQNGYIIRYAKSCKFNDVFLVEFIKMNV